MNELSTVLFNGHFGGTISVVGQRSLRATYPYRFVNFLLFVPTLTFVLAMFFPVLGWYYLSQHPLLMLGLPIAIICGVIGYRRTLSMGTIALDLEAGTLQRIDGNEYEEWPIQDIVWLGMRRDWLVIELRDCRKLRLGKGKADEFDRALHLLKDWGLPVG